MPCGASRLGKEKSLLWSRKWWAKKTVLFLKKKNANSNYLFFYCKNYLK
jgi:hypothetical protein